MYQSIKATACAVVLALVASPSAVADFEQPQISVSHMAQHMRPGHQGVARCVKAIQQRWDGGAKLVLDMRATLRESETQQVLLVGGAVWENGERVRVEHECSTGKVNRQFALQVRTIGQPMVASK